MISHLSLGVRNLDRSADFYDAILRPLGSSRSPAAKAGEIAYGPNGQGIFWLYEVNGEGVLASPGSHVAFKVENRDALHAAAALARTAGSEFTREAGPHPDIAPDYYGAIFFDPDGHKIELVIE